MSRNRQVWPREQVAHLWANASQDSARDPSGNMFFNGPALYSYGSHYVIGYRYATADGDAAAVSAAFRGLHVGPFTLSEIRADGSAVIGCHDIPHGEMAAMAARLNLEA